MKPSLWKSLKRAAYRLRRKERAQRSELDGVIERYVAKMREKPQNGPDWNMNAHVEKFAYVLKSELDLWVNAEVEIPILRHLNGRLVRSDGRLTMAATILSNACAMDYETCNVGTPEPDEKGRPFHWKGRSMTFHEEVTGRKGCKDAMQGFYERGLMSRFPQWEADAEYEIHNRASVRHFFPDFFCSLGDKVWEALKATQEALCEAAKQAKEKLVEKAEALGRTVARSAEAMRNKGQRKRQDSGKPQGVGSILEKFGLGQKPAPT
jgi:hypothetical protein